ncbi:MAG: hypothetical protein KBD53_05640 [Candidatus Omnitrophica bacterium]|nr:hypothetical protein [Candidatus Omnitrophota bacterium]
MKNKDFLYLPLITIWLTVLVVTAFFVRWDNATRLSKYTIDEFVFYRMAKQVNVD